MCYNGEVVYYLPPKSWRDPLNLSSYSFSIFFPLNSENIISRWKIAFKRVCGVVWYPTSFGSWRPRSKSGQTHFGHVFSFEDIFFRLRLYVQKSSLFWEDVEINISLNPRTREECDCRHPVAQFSCQGFQSTHSWRVRPVNSPAFVRVLLFQSTHSWRVRLSDIGLACSS